MPGKSTGPRVRRRGIRWDRERSAELEWCGKLSACGEYAHLMKKHVGCYACMLECGKVRELTSGPHAGVTEGPQYETVWSFTGPTGCANLDAAIYADYLCCELGLDTISTGAAIEFACELFETGILTEQDSGGLVLRYGDPQAMLALIDKIGRREGFGEIPAEGVKRAAERIGKGSEACVIHVKGQEMLGYDPRALKGIGIGYALGNVGAHYHYGYVGQEIGNTKPRPLDPAAEEGRGTS